MSKGESAKPILRKLGPILAGVGIVAAAPAAANTGDMDIETTVVSTCSATATALDFGVLDIANITQKDASATVTVTCVGLTIFRVELDNGNNPDATNRRRIANGSGDFLNYEVYRNNARTQRWGTGVGRSRLGVIIIPGSSADFEAYGRVTGIAPTTRTGVYTDTLTVTVVL